MKKLFIALVFVSASAFSAQAQSTCLTAESDQNPIKIQAKTNWLIVNDHILGI